MAVLGVSGSPKVGGNTDRMIKAVLEKSGRETDFINLSTLRFDPCRGCCHLCASTNMCGIKDEIHPYLQLVLEAEALVLGTPFQLGMPTGFMFNFLTRLECFHHVKIALADKPAILISVGCKPKELQINEGIARFESMVTHSDQISSLGHIYFHSESPPCLRCGEGHNCYVGGLWKYVLGEDENKLKNFNVSTEMIQNWEDNPQIVEEVNSCSKLLAELQVKN
ncbi:flavodoxin family protein [Planctomycetota bacterium]